MASILNKNCKTVMCDKNIHSLSDWRKSLQRVKSDLVKNGVHQYESDPVYIKLMQCKDDIQPEYMCNKNKTHKNKNPSSHSNDDKSSFLRKRELLKQSIRNGEELIQKIKTATEGTISRIKSNERDLELAENLSDLYKNDITLGKKNIEKLEKTLKSKFLVFRKTLQSRLDDLRERVDGYENNVESLEGRIKMLKKNIQDDKNSIKKMEDNLNQTKEVIQEAKKTLEQLEKEEVEREKKQKEEEAERSRKRKEEEAERSRKRKEAAEERERAKKTKTKKASPKTKKASPGASPSSFEHDLNKRCPNGYQRNKTTKRCQKK